MHGNTYYYYDEYKLKYDEMIELEERNTYTTKYMRLWSFVNFIKVTTTSISSFLKKHVPISFQ